MVEQAKAKLVIGLIFLPCAFQLLGDVVRVRGKKSSAGSGLKMIALTTAMNLTQTRIIFKAWKCTKAKKESGAFNGVRTINALLGSFPQSILQTSLLLNGLAADGEWGSNSLLLLLSLSFSVFSVGRAMTSFELAFRDMGATATFTRLLAHAPHNQ